MYFVKFTIKDLSTKEIRIKESGNLENYEQAEKIVDNYIKNVKNYLDIKFMGDNTIVVKKFGGEIKIEIKERGI